MPAESNVETYQALLLRDWATHRRVILLGMFGPLIMAAFASFSVIHQLSDPSTSRNFLSFAMFGGPLFLALLGVSLHNQELRQGTLGDLLALPVSRTLLVDLRFIEAIGASVVYVLLMAVPYSIATPGGFQDVIQLLTSPALPWIWVVFFAYPLPATLRWGMKGTGAALAALFALPFLLTGLMALSQRFQLQWLDATLWLQKIADVCARARNPLGQHHLGFLWDFGIPLLLILFFHRLSNAALKRVDA